MKTRLPWILAATIVAWSAPAGASTLPKADFGRSTTLGIGGGQSLGLSIDAPIEGSWSIGAALSTRSFVGANVDVRALFRFWHAGRDPLTLAALVGVQAGGPAFNSLTAFAPVVGVAAAYPITSQWTVRANLAAAVYGVDNVRPAGFELAYRFHPRMEGTIGFNGRGEVLGLKLAL